MKLEEYLATVTDQIRCVKARELVSDELRDHILDQAEAYESEGMFEEEALERAVRDMGDPVETGVSLDRIHRPQMEKSVLALIGIISVLSIGIHAVLLGYSEQLAVSGYGYLKNHIMYTVYGYILMLLMYRLDYSILGKYGKQIAAVFLFFFMVIGSRFGMVINGQLLYIDFGGILLSIPAWMYLYVPLFAAVMYHYRGQGYRALGKLFLWAAIPLLFIFHLPAFPLAMLMGTAFTCLVSVAVWKGWYQVNCKKVLGVLWGMVLAGPVMVPALLYISGNLAAYQIDRIRAFIENNPNNYTANMLAQVIAQSHFAGRNEESMVTLAQSVPGFNSDYILVSMISAYGILAGVLVIALFAFLIGKIFRISVRQKNQLGMILGISCGLIFLLQLVLNLAVNLGMVPMTATTLPFFSSGGSSIMVSYTLLGVVLSVYRYKNILSDVRTKKYYEEALKNAE